MAMEYRFLNRDDDVLIETSELPVEEGIAVAIRCTGYELGVDEIVQLSIVDFQGNELFSQVVKPQNIEDWNDADASGGIMPSDVAEAPELFQFEDEISELFENASIVVGQHMGFIHEIIESSWVSLPNCKEYDLTGEFCASHCDAEYPGQPAVAAALPGIADYYGIACEQTDATAIARTVASCYVALITEHAQVRLDKGEQHWEAYEQRKAEALKTDERAQAAERLTEIKALRTNAILWICGFAIFSNLAVQLYVRGFNTGLVVVAAAAAVYVAVRCILCLYSLFKLRNPKQ